MKIMMTLMAFAVLTGCAVPLTPAAESVQLVTATQKDRCSRIKLITIHRNSGIDKPGNAMKGALNQTAAAGGDSFYIVSATMDWIDGASVIGEALRCKS